MECQLLLVNSITLLYRESQLEYAEDDSKKLIHEVMDSVQIPDIGVGIRGIRDTIMALKSTINEMIENPKDHLYDSRVLLQRLRINCGDDQYLYDALEKGIYGTLTESDLKRTVSNIKKSIRNHFKEMKIADILTKAATSFRYHREKIKDIGEFINDVLVQLEPLQNKDLEKDPAIVSDIDINDEEKTTAMFTEMKNNNSSLGILKTGWHRLNKMLQGGFRRGEFTTIGALQHKYKTGVTLSIFKQIALYNTPYMINENKKPLLLRISFEDDLENNLQFLYQSLKYDETREPVDINAVSSAEMSAYIKQRMHVNGYHIKLLRVDPTQWTYKNLCAKITELESKGYEIHLLMVDYLAMLPTTGCTQSGLLGDGVRELFRKIRNFCSPRKIAVITPHQLSTEAKQLIRNGVSEESFVKDIAERGYWMGSRSLDTECDLMIVMHKFKSGNDTYLAFQRDKHRIATIVQDEDKYFILKFPYKMPIPDDIEGADSGFSKIPREGSVANTCIF